MFFASIALPLNLHYLGNQRSFQIILDISTLVYIVWNVSLSTAILVSLIFQWLLHISGSPSIGAK